MGGVGVRSQIVLLVKTVKTAKTEINVLSRLPGIIHDSLCGAKGFL